MALSGAAVRAALAAVGAVGGQMRSFDELAAGADAALRQAPPGLTAAGAASFLADKAQESAYFRTCTEYGKTLRYDPYRGRSFQMITWESNYRLFGRWLAARGLLRDPETFVKNPAELSDYRWAWLGGVWYFEANNLWPWANAGDHLRVSQAVNGGRGRAGTRFVPNHWRERDAMFRAFRLAGDTLLPTAGPAPAALPPPAVPSRRSGEDMPQLREYSPEPKAGQAKFDWPRRRVSLPFDPINGWGGKCVLLTSFGPRGGWLHLARWWIRDTGWTASRPLHHPFDHPLGTSGGKPGSERFIGYGWQTAPPVGADEIEVEFSAPDGMHMIVTYEK